MTNYVRNNLKWAAELRYSARLYRMPEYLDERKAKSCDKWAEKLEKRAQRFMEKMR